MRITGGEWRGRKLAVPEGQSVRPTSDMVRQAIFNILQSHDYPRGAFVIDAFCGTGALGLEALSRGAERCVFMDKDKQSLSFARRNVMNVKADERCLFLQCDVAHPPPIGDLAEPVDLLFLDPPYRMGLVHSSVIALAAAGWLASGAVCIAECEKDQTAFAPPGFTLMDDRVYGSTRVLFSRYIADNLPELP
jgi:16S rRNA (guanine966-N2)-methyltransferase